MAKNEKAQTPERAAARAALFAEEAPETYAARVTFNDVEFEVRAPSLAQIKSARTFATDKDGNFDPDRQVLKLIIDSTFVPATGEPAFERADLETLLARPVTSSMRLMKALGAPLQEMVKAATQEAAEKNS